MARERLRGDALLEKPGEFSGIFGRCRSDNDYHLLSFNPRDKKRGALLSESTSFASGVKKL